MWPWANCLTSLSFHFFICTMGVVISIFTWSECSENAVQGASFQCYDHTTNGSFVSPTYLWALGRKDWVLDIGPPSCFFSATYHLVAFDQRCAERTLSDLTRQLSSGFGRRCPSFSHVTHSFIHQQILVDTIPLSINRCGNRGRVIQQDCSSLL